MISLRQGIENILACYFAGNEKHHRHGRAWYRQAHDWCAETAEDLNIPMRTFAGVVAALSPSCAWERNQMDAVRLVQTKGQCKVTTYNRNKAKALDILWTNDTNALGGPKVRAFFDCIVNPKADSVVIDRHARRVWEGRYLADEDARVTEYQYPKIAEAYRGAAAIAGLLPNEMQAITWVIYRNSLG